MHLKEDIIKAIDNISEQQLKTLQEWLHNLEAVIQLSQQRSQLSLE